METLTSEQFLIERAEMLQWDAHSLEVVLEALPVAISWASLATQKILFVNRHFTEIFGYVLEDLADISTWIGAYPDADDRETAGRRWSEHFLKSRFEVAVPSCEIRVCSKDGPVKTVMHSGVILPKEGWALATFVDITDRKRAEVLQQEAEVQAREGQAIYRLLLDHSPGMTVLSSFDNSRRYVSPGVLQVTGFTAEEYLGLRGLAMVHPEDHEAARASVVGVKAGELSHVFRYRALQKTGGFRWAEANVRGYLDPVTQKAGGYVVNVRDIDELKRREDLQATSYQQLAEDASLDVLTGIANRRTFNRTIESRLGPQRRSRELSLLLLDVDCFKQFNDGYGHLPGDECLRQVATCLQQTVHRRDDLAARFGGDEFVALLPGTGAAGAQVIAQKIVHAVAALRIPHCGNRHGIVTVSIGVASWPADVALEQSRIMELADRALYQAKNQGRNQFVLLQRGQTE